MNTSAAIDMAGRPDAPRPPEKDMPALRWLGRALRFLRRFRRGEEGSPTVEFVIVFPVIMTFVASACESGLLLTRQMMLQHGVEMSGRAVRLGVGDEVTDEEIRRMVCTGAGIIPDCMESLKVEMIRIDPNNWQSPPAIPDCVDRSEPATPNRTFEHGIDHELMLIRVCALFDPMFPNFGHGVQLSRERGGDYALVASTLFVMEPG